MAWAVRTRRSVCLGTTHKASHQQAMRCVRPSCACGSNGPLEEFTLEEVRVRVAVTTGLTNLYCTSGIAWWDPCFGGVVRALERAVNVVGPRRMAVLLSRPMSNGLSFLYMFGLLHRHDKHREQVQQLLDIVQGLPLCPNVGSTWHGGVLSIV